MRCSYFPYKYTVSIIKRYFYNKCTCEEANQQWWNWVLRNPALYPALGAPNWVLKLSFQTWTTDLIQNRVFGSKCSVIGYRSKIWRVPSRATECAPTERSHTEGSLTWHWSITHEPRSVCIFTVRELDPLKEHSHSAGQRQKKRNGETFKDTTAAGKEPFNKIWGEI